MKGAILLAATGWDNALWARLFGEASERQVYVDPDGRDDDNVHYAIVWNQPPGSLKNLKNLKVIFSLGAGVDHVFRDPHVPDVPIVRVVSDDLTNRMSEYILWQVLDHHRMGPKYRQQQRDKVWLEDRSQSAAKDITVGVMGLGVLGGDAARKLKGIGFQVAGWSRSVHALEDIPTYHGADGLAPFLAGLDILVCLLPLTPDTTGILNTALIRQMTKRGPLGAPVIINAGRGGLQNGADLLAALDTGLLSAVSLDVFQSEPLPQESPFWTHPKVTITPHAAAASDPYALVQPIVDQMEAYDRGDPLRNVVDRKHQY
jgi:glyoxylate/hydroxypyruvate reductase A